MSRLPLGFAFVLAACTSASHPAPSARADASAPATLAPSGPTAEALATEAALRNRAGVAPEQEVAVLGGGCFWGLEELLRKLDGVVRTDAGYTGGSVETAHYERLHDGDTGHAETVRVVFDPKRIAYDALLTAYFRMHDPTTPNRQGNDVGSQYRSVIFAQSPEQERAARAVKARLDASGKLAKPVVTEIVPAMIFTPAEDEHQDYLEKHPGGYTCHYVRDFTF